MASASRMDSFTLAYFEAALWSTSDESDDQGGEPLDKNYSIGDFDDATRDKMIDDCVDFQKRYAGMLDNAYGEGGIDSGRAGHNFWLSRNGHGAGFFDDDLDDLQEAAKSYGEFNLYVGDDGEIHGSPLGAHGAQGRAAYSHGYAKETKMTKIRNHRKPRPKSKTTHRSPKHAFRIGQDVAMISNPTQLGHVAGFDPDGSVMVQWSGGRAVSGVDARNLRAIGLGYAGRRASEARPLPRRPPHARETDERDQCWVDLDDGEALDLMQGWTGGERDPLYAISSSGGNYAWVFTDAIANLDADLRRVKKLGRDKFQLGLGTFSGEEINELNIIRDALAEALRDAS